MCTILRIGSDVHVSRSTGVPQGTLPNSCSNLKYQECSNEIILSPIVKVNHSILCTSIKNMRVAALRTCRLEYAHVVSIPTSPICTSCHNMNLTSTYTSSKCWIYHYAHLVLCVSRRGEISTTIASIIFRQVLSDLQIAGKSRLQLGLVFHHQYGIVCTVALQGSPT